MDAPSWILHNNYGLLWLVHYLDDYFIAGPPGSSSCSAHLKVFLGICSRLSIPIAMDKVEGPTRALTFLDLELDSTLQQICLLQDKLTDLLTELQSWLDRKKTTKCHLLSLIGKLAFAAKAIPAGRLFVRSLITLSTRVARLHHQLYLNKQARADISWWMDFLPTWNGTAHFIDPNSIHAPDLDLRRLWISRFWGIFPRQVVPLLLATGPATSLQGYLHPLARAVCYRCGCTNMGALMGEETHQVLL